jgi:hypothetical protein
MWSQNLKNTLFWDVSPRSLVKILQYIIKIYQRVGRRYINLAIDTAVKQHMKPSFGGSGSSLTLVLIYKTTRRQMPEDCNINTHRRENLKYHSQNF